MPERGVTYWDWTLMPLKNPRGEVESFIFSLADVTERVRAREHLLEAERSRAQRAETVALEINHRMKNNLMLVSGMLELQLAALPPASEAAAALQQAKARIAALSTVHEQMYGRRSGRVELRDVLRRIGEVAVAALALADVELSVTGDPVYVPSRAATTFAVVSNELVTNALKHGGPAPDGRRGVRVALSHQNGALRLTVWNSGNPIPPGFDPAGQRGLGLQLCRELVAGELRGTFTMSPQAGGTISEIVVDDSQLGLAGGDQPI
jgi:two-component sensor histidine kinase